MKLEFIAKLRFNLIFLSFRISVTVFYIFYYRVFYFLFVCLLRYYITGEHERTSVFPDDARFSAASHR